MNATISLSAMLLLVYGEGVIDNHMVTNARTLLYAPIPPIHGIHPSSQQREQVPQSTTPTASEAVCCNRIYQQYKAIGPQAKPPVTTKAPVVNTLTTGMIAFRDGIPQN